jgi:hypothetical protein
MSQPALLSGSVIEPDHISAPGSFATRDFLNVVRDLLHRVTYHEEAERQRALTAVDAFERISIPAADRDHVVAEGDRAPVEDVTQRKAPNSNLPLAAVGQNIDYARLAAAIVAAQAQAAQTPGTAIGRIEPVQVPADQVHVVTDAPLVEQKLL